MQELRKIKKPLPDEYPAYSSIYMDLMPDGATMSLGSGNDSFIFGIPD